MTLDARRDRTALRLKLYQNGFTPLANKNKMCLIKEWSTLKVTPELIQSRQWARSHAFLDTGLRCGDIIALDWDIDDKALLNDLLDAAVEQGLIDESSFVRIGKAPRELWVYRTSDKIGKRTTGHFVPPGAPEDASGYAVEILGAGCQFAAFGQRDENTAYQWPVDSLLEHAYMDLPVITLAQVEALKEFCIAFFEQHGLTRASAAGGTDGGYTHVYDLTPDMVFNIKDQGDMSVGELAEALAADPEATWRCSVEAFRPTSGSWAGMVSLVHGALCVSDHGTYTSHFPAGLDTELPDSTAALGKLLADKFPAPATAPKTDLRLDPRLGFDENLGRALKRYVFVKSDALVCDSISGFMINTTKQFRDAMAPYYSTEKGPRGAETITWLCDLWMRHPDRLEVKDMQMRPDQTSMIFTNDNSFHLNTYDPPILPREGGDARIGLELIDSLLPNPEERRWYLQWLAFKFRNPAIPGAAVVMVAKDTYGTGRGSVVKLLEKLFGQRYVKSVNFGTLIGKGSQSQYNEWMTDSLIVAVNEASESDATASRWQTRNNAYEHLKDIVDPAVERWVHVKRKSVKNGDLRTFASFHIASNHSDALVIPANDRRFGVLENGDTPHPEFFAAFYRWLAVPANVGAFARSLEAMDLSTYSPFTAPPMTAAKADMIDAGTSELDKAAAAVLAKPAGALMVKEQFFLLLENVMLAEGYEFPEDWQKVAGRIFINKSRRMLVPDRHVVEGRMRTVRMVAPCSPDAFQSLPEMLGEIARNGPTVRPIKSSGTVVNFSDGRKSL